MPEMTDAYEWHGRTLVGTDGEKIGNISDIYDDPQTGRPEWATVTTGLFGTKSSFVPLAGAAPVGENVRAQVTKDQVQDAPKIDPDEELSEQEEARLFAHYGVPYSPGASVTTHGQSQFGEERAWTAPEPPAHGVSGSETDEAMTRSEEELRVGTRQRESGRVRLRKYVVTEQVTTTIPVRREVVRVEREPITDANVGRALDGPEISAEEYEVVLHEEEPVVEKRVVPKERVQLSKDSFAEEREVSEQVRKERLEIDEQDRVSHG